MVANESQVWRLVHRTEFEAPREPRDIKKWQIVRILLQDMISDFTGIVKEVGHETALLAIFSQILPLKPLILCNWFQKNCAKF